jgi:hypothetical protein
MLPACCPAAPDPHRALHGTIHMQNDALLYPGRRGEKSRRHGDRDIMKHQPHPQAQLLQTHGSMKTNTPDPNILGKAKNHHCVDEAVMHARKSLTYAPHSNAKDREHNKEAMVCSHMNTNDKARTHDQKARTCSQPTGTLFFPTLTKQYRHHLCRSCTLRR